MVFHLILSYRGGGYAGWQRQDNAVAVQQVVEEALEDLFGRLIRVIAASRTDAGVHARGQSAHVVLPRPFPARGLVHALNHRLPEDIRVLRARRMPVGFHALACAEGKEYRYRLSRAPVLSPLDNLFVAPLRREVDLRVLIAAAALLPGRHDFSAFAMRGGSHTQAFRRLREAAWEEHGEDLVLRLVGDGFLRGMVRALVGTLIEVGAGRRSLEDFATLLGGGERDDAGPNAPACGLVLERVFYPPRWRDDAPGAGPWMW